MHQRSTYSFITYLTVLLALFSTTHDLQAKIKDQQLVIGRSITLDTKYEIGDIAITDPSILDYVVRENRKEIYLNPLKEGYVTLTIWNNRDKIQDTVTFNVVSVALDSILQDLKENLRKATGIRINVINNETIVMSGQANSKSELELARNLSNKYAQVQNEVSLSKRVIQVMAQQIEKAVGMPGVHVRSVRGALMLEGVVYSQDAHKKADTIARLYEKDIINVIEVRPSNRRPGKDKSVKIDVYFMEIKNSAIKSFGINWAPGAQIQSAANNNVGSGTTFGLIDVNAIVGFIFNLLPKLRWINETNRGRVLERANFIVKSGQSTDFYSGTEIPYFSSQGKVTFKEVGVSVKASPIVSGNDVDLEIDVGVSAPSSSVSQGIDKNNITTTTYVKSGHSVVLGGLLRNNDTKSYNKVPDGLDTNSALFTLFLSKDFRTNKSQFYIFIKPRIVDQPTGAELELRRWLEVNDKIDQERL